MNQGTERLKADGPGVARAAELLRAGRLVAFPTETVYGLGADATNGKAVAAVYEAKGRPTFNPLIVHVSSIEKARKIGDIPKAGEAFLDGGWPEGLTVVVPLRAGASIASLVTAGLPSVGLRVPALAIAKELLHAVGRPVAAPSANPSGLISPTTADHVLRGLDGRIAAVLDGGATTAGLESTIIGFSGDAPVVLREGAFEVPDSMPRQTAAKQTNEVQAPGQMTSHYAPKGTVRTNVVAPRPGEWHLGFGDVQGNVSLSPNGDLAEAAARLFACLHEADARGAMRIAVAPIPDTGLGRAINDRLARAAAPR
ncbi:MAG: threonylcarbamoyl-AMP synthase [Silicimonas sp.]|nr:threonylcarbamoyl-AMP synthase [Silicimonas sp.]